MTDQVCIFDTTLRDGEQSPGVALTVDDKLEIARQLEKLGVDIIEAGFPSSSPGDFESVTSIAAKVRGCAIAGLARAHQGDVDRCWEAVQGAAHPRVHVFLSTSDIHLMHQLRKNRDEVLEMGRTAVARAKGYTEGIALDIYGHVSEGSGENIFIVRDGAIITPPFGSSILPGITRNTILKLSDEMGLKVIEEQIPREALYIADEVFFTGSAAEITPISKIDGIQIGAGKRGPITEKLQKAFFAIFEDSRNKYGWLTYVK